MTAVDILYVASGTTAGLRRADAAMLQALTRCDMATATVTGSYAAPTVLRSRIYSSAATIDLYESAALSRAVSKAMARYSPRAIIYGTTHAALLRPVAAAGIPSAIRFDTPAQISRVGRRYEPEHRLERRRFRQARVLLPWGLHVVPEIGRVLPASTPVVALPVPVEQADGLAPREPTAVVYAGSPGKKGLDVVVRAWAQVDTGNRRLIVTGISERDGRHFLTQRGIPVPEGTEWPGLVDNAEFRALTRRAEIYLSASTYENYGLAQLEALADGALLVTTTSEGPFAAFEVARELAPELVAADRCPHALAGALRHAIELPEAQRHSYRERARALMAGYSLQALEERLRSRVLPLILSGE